MKNTTCFPGSADERGEATHSTQADMNVKLDDLVLAHEWVSADAGGDNEACVCPASGAIHYFEAGVPVDPDSPVLAGLEESCGPGMRSRKRP